MDAIQVVYTDVLVRNLIYISELNVQINEYLNTIERNSPKFLELENTIKSEILFNYIHCLNINAKYREAKSFALGMNKTPENTKERLMLNSRNVFDYINASYQSEKFGLAVLVHLNKLFLDDVKDIWDIGKMIVDKNDVDSTFDFELDKKIVLQSHVSGYIKVLDDYYYSSSCAEILKNAVVFYELLHLGIFACGSDATSLGMLSFLYKKTGFNKFMNYYRCVNNIRNAKTKSDLSDDVNSWLPLFFNELAKELKDIKLRLTPFVDEVRAESTKYVDLNLRQIKALNYLKDKGRISREIYCKLNNVSQITSYRDLTNLLQKGYIRVEGVGKGTKYVL